MAKSKLKNHDEFLFSLEQKKRDLHFKSYEDLLKYLTFLEKHNLLDKEQEVIIL
jgi:hypothetical protein